MSSKIAPSCFLLVAAVALAGPNLLQFDQIFPPAKQQGMGLHKLSDAEKAALQEHVESLLVAVATDARGKVPPLLDRNAAEPQQQAIAPGRSPVYITKIEEDDGDVLKLENGAIVEVVQGFIGFVGFRKDAALFRDGLRWRIWIEGKEAHQCDVLRFPDTRPTGTGEVAHLFEVKADGKVLTMLDGTRYLVDDLDVFTTSMWLGISDVLVIDGVRLLNLRESGEIVHVSRLR